MNFPIFGENENKTGYFIKLVVLNLLNFIIYYYNLRNLQYFNSFKNLLYINLLIHN